MNDVRTIIQQQNRYIYIPDLRAYATIDWEQLTGPVSFEVLHSNFAKQTLNPLSSMIPELEES